MKKFFTFLSAILLFTTSFATATDKITLDEKSNMQKDYQNAQVIAQVPKGTTLDVIEAKSGWKKVEYEKVTGWIYSGVDMNNSDNVVIHVINLKQSRGDANSDSILIQCGGENVLIDGGRENDAATVHNFLVGLGVKSLKYVIATHEDIDHSQGLSVLMQNYPDIAVDAFYSSEFYRTDTTFNIGKVLSKRRIPSLEVKAGGSLNVGRAKLTCLAPLRDYPHNCKEEGIYYSRQNQLSFVLKLELGDTSMMFMGDADSTMVSNELLARYGAEKLKSDVLWYPHHGIGPKVANFFNAVSPMYGIASRSSTPEENAFPFLTEEVKQLKEKLGTQDYISCNGNIKIGMDGTSVSVEQ